MVNVFEVMNPKKNRKLTVADKKAMNKVAQRILLQDLLEMEMRAHDIGMTITAHALNNAKNAAGWELAGDSIQAGRAARGLRPGEKE